MLKIQYLQPFFVGSTRPYQTDSILQAGGSGSSNNFVTATLEYREIGTNLTVTPFLGSGDVITMEIVQESSSYQGNATASTSGSSGGGTNFQLVPITNNSKTTTRVHVPNEHFLVLSGMIQDTKHDLNQPCLV